MHLTNLTCVLLQPGAPPSQAPSLHWLPHGTVSCRLCTDEVVWKPSHSCGAACVHTYLHNGLSFALLGADVTACLLTYLSSSLSSPCGQRRASLRSGASHITLPVCFFGCFPCMQGLFESRLLQPWQKEYHDSRGSGIAPAMMKYRSYHKRARTGCSTHHTALCTCATCSPRKTLGPLVRPWSGPQLLFCKAMTSGLAALSVLCRDKTYDAATRQTHMHSSWQHTTGSSWRAPAYILPITELIRASSLSRLCCWRCPVVPAGGTYRRWPPRKCSAKPQLANDRDLPDEY